MTISSIGASTATVQAQAAHVHRKPPQAPEQGAGKPEGSNPLIDAIGSALSAVGMGSSASATVSASDSQSATATDGSADPAAALGDFIHSLFDALHAQGSAASKPAGGEAGGGALQSDLQSLIQKLASGASTDTASDSATTSLESAFSKLAGALGLDSSDTSSRLGSFLQALSDKLQGAGSSGNLIDTSA